MKKRICSILLVLALFLGLVPDVALATDENENLALNAEVLGVSKEPPNEKEHAKYALDGNREYTKWCAVAATGWMVFQTKEAVAPVGMMAYHAGWGVEETRKNNTMKYQLEVLNSDVLSEADFLNMSAQDQAAVMSADRNWTPVTETVNNENRCRYSDVSMPEARSVFRFHILAAGQDNTIRIFEVELLNQTFAPESMSMEDISMSVEDTIRLRVQFTPEYCVEPVTCSVADPDIVEYADGMLYGKKPGTTTITVTAVHSPQLQATAQVTVNERDYYEYPDSVPIWRESFEGESLPKGWTVEDHDEDGHCWELRTSGSNARVHHGKQSICSDSRVGLENLAPDNWLITPEFLVGYDYTFTIEGIGSDSGSGKEGVQFYILENGTMEHYEHATFYIKGKGWREVIASLDNYEGHRIRIAIVHTGVDPNGTLSLDCAALWRPDLAEHTANVIFRVQNGTWDGQDQVDKIVEVELKNGYGTLPASAVPTNMQPAPGYEKGSWNMVPNVDENGVVGDIVYTYTFDKKPDVKGEATVTFQVVHGVFADSETDTRTLAVELTNGKGTLSPEDVPEPSEMIPEVGYDLGAWDVAPNTEKDGITQDVTYRYVFTSVEGVPIWEESFEGGSLPEGWTVEDHDEDGCTWEICTDKALGGQQSLLSVPGMYNSEGFVDNWLITPEFLAGYKYEFNIEACGSEQNAAGEPVALYVLREGRGPKELKVYTIVGVDWNHLRFDLDAYEGQRIRLAFAHRSRTQDATLYVDNAALCRPNLAQHNAHVTFKIQNGTWDGQDQADKVVDVELQNGYGTLPESAVPTNMQPDPGYEKGAWNVVPNVDENGVVGDIVYTYTFAEKLVPKDYATVTFRVVNGIFDNLNNIQQVTVKLTNGKGTLSPEDVPDPSEMIATLGYGLGAWDVTPNTEKDAITQDVTYRYVFVPVVTIELNVSGCTWADGKCNTIPYTLSRENGPAFLTEEQVPTGMIPDEYHLPEGGAWYINGAPMMRIDNLLEYPIKNNTGFYYIFEGKHIILPERTLLLHGTDMEVYVQKDLGELTCDDPSVEIEHLYDRPDFSLYGVTIPDVPKTYTFTAVDPTDGNKEITAQVQVLAESPFSDVKKHHWFCDEVMWAVENGITDGFPDGTFKPNADCTRAQIVTFLWRSEGSPEPQCTESPFTDVDSDDWFYKAVLWAVENEITDGFPDGTFKPKDPCTRAQAVTFLYRLYGFEMEDMPWEDMENVFPDVKKEWYYEAVMWAAYIEMVGGFPDGTFRPKEICTRAQIVTLLYRVC